MERDLDKNPYSKDEQRVVDYLTSRAEIGGGDDPIGFLLSSYEYLIRDRNHWREARKAAIEGGDFLKRELDKLRAQLKANVQD